LIRALVGKDVILKAPHQVERYFNVLGYDQEERDSYRLSPPLLRVGDQDQLEANAIVGRCGRKEPLIGIFPGSRHPNKRWPVKKVASLADRCRQAGFSVAILGGEDDGFQSRAVSDCMAKTPELMHTGGSLGKLAGIISRCAAVVSPDSGPAHMAAALSVPVVTIFGPTSHERWAPTGPKSRVVRVELPCSPCSNHGGSSCPLGTLECMEAISPEQVWQTLSDLIG
jgi:lipopolysaccharide heptosyltransferase II